MRVTAERYLSLQEVGDQLGVTDQTVRRWVKAGELAAYKPGKEYRIKGSDLEEFLKTREVSPKVQSPLPEQQQRADIGDVGEAFFVPLEDGEEEDTVTLQIYYVRLLEDGEPILQAVREASPEERASMRKLEKTGRTRE